MTVTIVPRQLWRGRAREPVTQNWKRKAELQIVRGEERGVNLTGALCKPTLSASQTLSREFIFKLTHWKSRRAVDKALTLVGSSQNSRQEAMTERSRRRSVPLIVVCFSADDSLALLYDDRAFFGKLMDE